MVANLSGENMRFSSNYSKMRGQGAIEYFIIVAAMLVLFASLTVSQMVDPTSAAARTSSQVAQARSAADTIANAINGVYANSEGAVMTEFISLSRTWDLKTNSDNLQIGIEIDGEMKWAKSSLKHGFDDSISNISSGSYTVIVKWASDEAEEINLDPENNKIHISINP